MVAIASLLLAAAAVVAQGPAPASPDHHGNNLVFNRALGVPCLHCHNPPGSAEAPRPAYLFAQRMMNMVEGLNASKLKELGGITCWTCHRGKAKPARLPRERGEALAVEYASVFVGPRAERTASMTVYAASLGKRCDHCHIEGLWGDETKYQKLLTFRMLSLFEEIPTYFEASRQPTLQCFLCHQGAVKPEREPAR
ncbi:MAG TPA: photosynthetic reaction center cytochrome c subunit family protein [Vicinamibacteria bacterium]|nr:photosynthetic reaction center cytochrome c subunit family protein [Vicinamibacteria bacterium]